jgi:hypothetical protein
MSVVFGTRETDLLESSTNFKTFFVSHSCIGNVCIILMIIQVHYSRRVEQTSSKSTRGRTNVHVRRPALGKDTNPMELYTKFIYRLVLVEARHHYWKSKSFADVLPCYAGRGHISPYFECRVCLRRV